MVLLETQLQRVFHETHHHVAKLVVVNHFETVKHVFSRKTALLPGFLIELAEFYYVVIQKRHQFADFYLMETRHIFPTGFAGLQKLFVQHTVFLHFITDNFQQLLVFLYAHRVYQFDLYQNHLRNQLDRLDFKILA